MTNTILGVAIGVVFVFMLFSLFLSASLEAISAAMKLRGRALRVAMAQMIGDPAERVGKGGFGLVDQAIERWFRKRESRPAAQSAHAALAADSVDPQAPECHELTLVNGDHQPWEPVRFLELFSHPLVAGVAGKDNPSYVPEANFTSALVHTLLRDKPEASIAALTERIMRLPPGPLRTALEGALMDARGDWNALRAGVDRWYANAMDRLSGEYKRFSQFITFLLGLVLAASFNIDAISIAQQLYADPVMREELADQAGEFVNRHAQDVQLQKKALADAAEAGAAAPEVLASRPLGAASGGDASEAYRQAIERWIQQRDLLTRTVPGATFAAQAPSWERIRHGWLGWLVTALAGMLGAPFWFDLLQKLTNLRGTGPKPVRSTEPA